MLYRTKGSIYRRARPGERGDLITEFSGIEVEALPGVEEPVTVFDRKGKRSIIRFLAMLPDGRRLTFAFSVVDIVCAAAEAEAELRGQMFVKGVGCVNPHVVVRRPVQEVKRLLART